MNKGTWTLLGVLVAVVAVALVAGGGYKAPGPAKGSPAPVASEGVQTSEAREITVSGSEFKFSLSSISLTKGETVKITFKNTGTLPHNLTIAELGVSTKTIGGGQEDSVTVTADKTGSYTFYCSVGSHRQQGMEGKLEVK